MRAHMRAIVLVLVLVSTVGMHGTDGTDDHYLLYHRHYILGYQILLKRGQQKTK